MPADPAAVVAALRDGLPSGAEVRLDDVDGRPQAVVTGCGLTETWVDLWTSIGAQPEADAAAVAVAVIEAEGWPQRAM